LKPSRKRTAIAPPSAFKPNAGFDPASSIRSIAMSGIRSQFVVSPNGALNRVPLR
jgi:hypothetical protein